MFAVSIGASEEAHDVRGMHFTMENSSQYSSGMNYWDCCLFFPGGVLLRNPGEVIGMTLEKYFGKMGHDDVGFA